MQSCCLQYVLGDTVDVIMARLLVLCELVRLLTAEVIDYGVMAKRSLLVHGRGMLPPELEGTYSLEIQTAVDPECHEAPQCYEFRLVSRSMIHFIEPTCITS